MEEWLPDDSRELATAARSCLLLLAALAGAPPAAARSQDPQPWPYHLEFDARADIREALDRGAAWLAARQTEDGAFPPLVRADACPVALTAIAVWALVESGADRPHREQEKLAVGWLRQWLQADGGLYDPSRGLPVFTTGISTAAVGALAARDGDEETRALWRRLASYAAVHPITESWVDAEQRTGTATVESSVRAAELLESAPTGEEGVQEALRFLVRCTTGTSDRPPVRARVPTESKSVGEPEVLVYDDLLALAYSPIGHDWPITRRALEAVRRLYTLERNPDLTRRYGEAGFQPGTQGLHYYYFVLSRILSANAQPTIDLATGEERDWVRELSTLLLSRQRPDGSWVNPDPAWWEDEPILVTAYALLALSSCFEMRDPPVKR